LQAAHQAIDRFERLLAERFEDEIHILNAEFKVEGGLVAHGQEKIGMR
jgi:hypothetical protein